MSEERNRQTWASSDFLDTNLRAQVLAADVLLLPIDGYSREGKLGFAGVAETLASVFTEAGLSAEIVASDENYTEIVLHGRFVHLGKILVQYAVFPVLLSVLANYIYDECDGSTAQSEVRVEIVVERHDGTTVSIKYDGSGTDFSSAIEATAAELGLAPTGTNSP